MTRSTEWRPGALLVLAALLACCSSDEGALLPTDPGAVERSNLMSMVSLRLEPSVQVLVDQGPIFVVPAYCSDPAAFPLDTSLCSPFGEPDLAALQDRLGATVIANSAEVVEFRVEPMPVQDGGLLITFGKVREIRGVKRLEVILHQSAENREVVDIAYVESSDGTVRLVETPVGATTTVVD